MEMETCYKHGELLAMRCRQCEIEAMSVVIVKNKSEDHLVMLAHAYLESLDFAAEYTFKTKEVFDAGRTLAKAVIAYFEPPGPFPGKIVPLNEIKRHIKESIKELGEELELPETIVRPAKKEDFKPNAWHKPPND